ncbi:hypothetical protein GCM10027020_32500 [Nocardioides salsibiostraticola]
MGRNAVESRTKSVTSFVGKALTLDPIDPTEFKYADPQAEITDTVGVRIIVPLSPDVGPVRDLLRRSYSIAEEDDRGSSDELEVPGYRSLHMLLRLGDEAQHDPDFRDMAGMVAEVQIRTILQHAWASIQHDLQYKSKGPTTPNLRRRLTALAGVLDLADREFVDVREQHGESGAGPRPKRDPMVADEPISAAATKRLVAGWVGDEPLDGVWFDVMANVLSELGYTTTGEVSKSLDSCRPDVAEIIAAIRSSRPHANSVQIIDLLLRVALDGVYAEKRLSGSILNDPREARRAFSAERSALVALLEAGQ